MWKLIVQDYSRLAKPRLQQRTRIFGAALLRRTELGQLVSTFLYKMNSFFIIFFYIWVGLDLTDYLVPMLKWSAVSNDQFFEGYFSSIVKST